MGCASNSRDREMRNISSALDSLFLNFLNTVLGGFFAQLLVAIAIAYVINLVVSDMIKKIKHKPETEEISREEAVKRIQIRAGLQVVIWMLSFYLAEKIVIFGWVLITQQSMAG